MKCNVFEIATFFQLHFIQSETKQANRFHVLVKHRTAVTIDVFSLLVVHVSLFQLLLHQKCERRFAPGDSAVLNCDTTAVIHRTRVLLAKQIATASLKSTWSVMEAVAMGSRTL
jgi:hypothetical protein